MNKEHRRSDMRGAKHDDPDFVAEKDDPVVAPPGKTAKPGGDPWAKFRVGAPGTAAEFRIPPLPDGFVLDSQAAAHPPLPEGFVLDKAASPSVGGRRSVTLNIGGRTVSVDDSFLKLSPEQQNDTVALAACRT
jgi:hypothetical protein